MISQPLPRVFSFHNMAKAGKENQYGFSVLPAAARLENLGEKLGCRQLHTSHNAPCLRKHCFQFLQKKLKTKCMWLFFFLRGWRGGGGGGGEQTRCIMGDVQMANSFHLNRGTPSRNYRQRNAFQIKGFVWEYLPVKMKENSHHSHIYPKASFVLGSFRAMLSSHSAYFCPLYRRYRISRFPVYKLVGFYVNSSKKPNTSMSFIVGLFKYFSWQFCCFYFQYGKLWIYFLEPSSESFTKDETIQMYTNEFGFWYNVICKQFT